MSGIDCQQVYDVARATVQSFSVDWGENTAGSETGILDAGDTVASAIVSVDDKPSGASDPTFGSVTVNSSTTYINGRACSAGEATSVTVTIGSSATYGAYRLKITATTANGFTLPRFVRFRVVEPQ